MPPKRQPRSRPRLPLSLSSQELHPLRPNFFVLLPQLERDSDNHFDGDRLIVQIYRLILPLFQRIQCCLVQQRGSRDDLHVDNISLFIEDCVDLHQTLNACLLREKRIRRAYLRYRFRGFDTPAYADRRVRSSRWKKRLGSRIQHTPDHSADHSAHLPSRHSAGHSPRNSVERIWFDGSFSNLGDFLRDDRRREELSTAHKHATHRRCFDRRARCRRWRWWRRWWGHEQHRSVLLDVDRVRVEQPEENGRRDYDYMQHHGDRNIQGL